MRNCLIVIPWALYSQAQARLGDAPRKRKAGVAQALVSGLQRGSAIPVLSVSSSRTRLFL